MNMNTKRTTMRPLTPDQRARKALDKKKYDEKRLTEYFRLEVFLPIRFKEPFLGGAIRDYLCALAFLHAGTKRKPSLRALVSRQAKEIEANLKLKE